MEIEIFQLEHGGFGYRVGGIYQEYDPDISGFIPMTEDRAIECAEIIRNRLL